MECEHPDGDILGTCSICGDMVCGECYNSIFNAMICGNHVPLEDEGEWEVIIYHVSPEAVEERRYFLNDQGVTLLINEGDDDVIELHVPVAEKDDAWELLHGESDDLIQCGTCRVLYSPEIGSCPGCGVGRETEH